MVKTPNVNSEGARELEKAGKQFDDFQEQVENLTLDRMNQAPRLDTAPSKQLSQQEIRKSEDIYLKPIRTVGCRDKFNEDYRSQYERDKQYVRFQADNKEVIGEAIDIWTRPYGGLPAEEWKVPVNKPVWGPRYLAEQIKRCTYHRLISEQSTMMSSDGLGTYHGSIIADKIVPRLEAHPVIEKSSVFMGSSNF